MELEASTVLIIIIIATTTLATFPILVLFSYLVKDAIHGIIGDNIGSDRIYSKLLKLLEIMGNKKSSRRKLNEFNFSLVGSLNELYSLLKVNLEDLNDNEMKKHKDLMDRQLPLLIEMTSHEQMNYEEYSNVKRLYSLPLENVVTAYKDSIEEHGEIKKEVYNVSLEYIRLLSEDILSVYDNNVLKNELIEQESLRRNVDNLNAGLTTLADFRSYREITSTDFKSYRKKITKPDKRMKYNALEDVQATIEHYEKVNKGVQ